LKYDFHCRLAISHQVADLLRASAVGVRADRPREALPAQRAPVLLPGVNANAVRKPFAEFEQRDLAVPLGGWLRRRGRFISNSLALSKNAAFPVGVAA